MHFSHSFQVETWIFFFQPQNVNKEMIRVLFTKQRIVSFVYLIFNYMTDI